MPPVVAAAIIGAGASVAGGAMQSRAAGNAAREQRRAADAAAAEQRRSSESAERFQREQAQHTWAQQEADRRANYDQWVARERRLGSIAEALGYGRREIPDYVPSTNPGFHQPQPQLTLADVQPGAPRPIGSGRTPAASGSTSFLPPGYGRDANGDVWLENSQTGERIRLPRGNGMPMSERVPSMPTGPVSGPTVPSARDVILARKFPQGSVGDVIRRRQALPPGAGV